MSSALIGETGHPQAFQTIIVGGSIAGLLDGLDAAVFYRLAFAVPPALLFQNIASGLLGRRSFHEGWYTVVLGIGLQFFIAIGAAAVFYVASRVFPVLFRRPWICGPAFGLGLYFFMHYVVVPLSAVPKRTVPVSVAELLDQLFSHSLFVGLPIALMARRSARVN
ncbi:MAG: hypothetical protein WBM11_16240 [Terriglobales bacterium]